MPSANRGHGKQSAAGASIQQPSNLSAHKTIFFIMDEVEVERISHETIQSFV